MFPDIDEIHEMLNKIADSIPEGIYRGLNGGIILLEELKYHRESEKNHPLYVLGEYVNGPMGRNVNIYYGSLSKAYAYEDIYTIEEKLEEVLFHELTHHLESLAGEEDLRIEDFINMKKYREKKRGK